MSDRGDQTRWKGRYALLDKGTNWRYQQDVAANRGRTRLPMIAKSNGLGGLPRRTTKTLRGKEGECSREGRLENDLHPGVRKSWKTCVAGVFSAVVPSTWSHRNRRGLGLKHCSTVSNVSEVRKRLHCVYSFIFEVVQRCTTRYNFVSNTARASAAMISSRRCYSWRGAWLETAEMPRRRKSCTH